MIMPRKLTANAVRILLPTGLALLLGVSGSASDLSPPEARAPAGVAQCAAALGRLQALSGAELDPGELEVLSWNIQKAGGDGWDSDLASVTQGVHLAFIQEADRHAGIGTVPDNALFESFAQGYTTEALETGVLTLSAGLPSLRCALTAREPWLGTPKATSITEHPLQGSRERLLTINLHAINFSLGLADFSGQFLALDELLSRHSGPVILAGDFNTWSASREALVQDFLNGHGLSAVEFTPDRRTRAFGRALDHIFVRGLETDRAWVVPVDSSDHNLLRARLRIASRP
jgi:endonuclease/exonuclease/phosphatase (EEP) superfamily protein YafD